MLCFSISTVRVNTYTARAAFRSSQLNSRHDKQWRCTYIKSSTNISHMVWDYQCVEFMVELSMYHLTRIWPSWPARINVSTWVRLFERILQGRGLYFCFVVKHQWSNGSRAPRQTESSRDRNLIQPISVGQRSSSVRETHPYHHWSVHSGQVKL